MIPASPPPVMAIDWNALRVTFNTWGRSSLWPQGHHLTREWFKRVLVDFTFWFFLRGKGELMDHNTGTRYPLHAGVCLCMTPGMDLEAWQLEGQSLTDCYFHQDFHSGERRLTPNEWPALPLYSEVTDIAFFDHATRRILMLLNQAKLSGSQELQHERVAAEQLLKGVLIDLLQSHQRPALSGTLRHHEQAISSVLSALFSEPRRFNSVSDLAKLSGYSEGHFRSLCLQITGITPRQQLINARIEQAKRYLRYSGLTIGMIAEMLGYDQVQYFHRQFKSETGMTAGEYRGAAKC